MNPYRISNAITGPYKGKSTWTESLKALLAYLTTPGVHL